jgi:hypothetical protein
MNKDLARSEADIEVIAADILAAAIIAWVT